MFQLSRLQQPCRLRSNPACTCDLSHTHALVGMQEDAHHVNDSCKPCTKKKTEICKPTSTADLIQPRTPCLYITPAATQVNKINQ